MLDSIHSGGLFDDEVSRHDRVDNLLAITRLSISFGCDHVQQLVIDKWVRWRIIGEYVHVSQDVIDQQVRLIVRFDWRRQRRRRILNFRNELLRVHFRRGVRRLSLGWVRNADIRSDVRLLNVRMCDDVACTRDEDWLQLSVSSVVRQDGTAAAVIRHGRSTTVVEAGSWLLGGTRRGPRCRQIGE